MKPEAGSVARTQKLYEDQPFLYTFEATVLSCERQEAPFDTCPVGAPFAVELDRTAFFPEAGGQPCDAGTLQGEPLYGVEIRDGRILHWLGHALPVGSRVVGAVDAPTRFARMQSHTGEHIFSGTAHRLYGIENVGFHMSADGEMTVDTSAPLEPNQIARIREEANRVIWDNRLVSVRYPSPKELASLSYRSKVALEGPVRLIEIEGCDLCACCAPHVERTGSVGLLYIKSVMKYKKGMRFTLLCGSYAFAYLNSLASAATAVAHACSARPEELCSVMEKREALLNEKKRELAALREALVDARLSALSPITGNLCLFEDDMDATLMRRIINRCIAQTDGLCGVFTPTEKDGKACFHYTLAFKSQSLAPYKNRILQALGGKGGGKDNMMTGVAEADRASIEAFFQAFSL